MTAFSSITGLVLKRSLEEAEQKFCAFGLRVIQTIRNDLNMPSNIREENPGSSGNVPPKIEPVTTAVTIEKAIDTAIKLIGMIQDKEIREEVQKNIADLKALVFEAGFRAEQNYRTLRGKLNKRQRHELEKLFKECEAKLEEALKEIREAVSAANSGEKEVAKDHFKKAQKLGREAADAYDALRNRKHQMIEENAPTQNGDEPL